MKQILIGTGNPAKFARYKSVLERFSDIQVISLKDLDKEALPIIEDGETAKENALKKAKIYADYTKIPTLSVDEALYIDGLPDNEQPRTKVRRYESDVALTDDEMLNKFQSKISKLKNKGITWIYAISLAHPDGEILYEEVHLKEEMTDTPSLPIIEGYPLSSLLFDPKKKKTQSQYNQDDWNEYLTPLYNKIQLIIDKFLKS
ncbi:non-canonical purine NTP pyrophosphatase [Bernardetia sp. OM2101]|uniref:non-canonical purine NTP pyrophosphatase n=1 Tax=Bernardetia sp. OM2101 TaxID=3344876 RepID=UPI0035CF630A